MAYRRPAIEVIQDFQNAAAALALPTLPALIAGPGYQIQDDVNAGVYSELNLAITSYAYVGLFSGAIVDLSNAPVLPADANAHKSVGFSLKNAFMVKVPALPETSLITGVLVDPNIFTDGTTGAFSSFDPDADGAPTFYVDIIDAVGIDPGDKGRKLVIDKTDDNTLVLAAEWATALPLNNVSYRVLEFRDEELYAETVFAANGITKTANSVDVLPGLKSTDTVPLSIVEGDVTLAWRALRPDLAGALNVFTDNDSLEAIFGIGAVIPANVGAYGINLALINTTTEVNFTGLGGDFFTAEETSFQSALEFLESKDVYGLAILTHNTAVHQLAASHVKGMSLSTVGRERVCFINRRILEIEVIIPASGIGNETSAGNGNGTSGTNSKTFRDPTNGSFITDDVGVGHFLEIFSFSVTDGVQRIVAPDERDFFDTGPDILRIGNAAFSGTDVGKLVLLRGSTTAANDLAYTISSVTDAEKVVVGTTPPAAEVMPSGARAWIVDLSQSVTHNAADNVVAATKTWQFLTGAFTAADIGRLLFMANTASGNDGVFTIGGVNSATEITTIEAPAGNETFGVGVTQDVYDVDREPARDAVSDSVDGSNRQWTILGAIFTSEDIGRVLRVAGATEAGNNTDHTIEAIISPTIARTDNSTTPVTEEFNGIDTATLSTLSIVSILPSTAEALFILNTRHKISAITSESQLTLDSDPTSGFGGELNTVEYRVTKDMTLVEIAEFIAGYAASFASRRVIHTWPDILAVSVNSLAVKIPGFFAGPVISGLTSGLPAQAGLTNLSVTGFIGRENSDDKFSDTQLDAIGGGGNFIFVQPVVGGALSIRHQLTTDLSTILFQEYSVTKNVDLVARFFRNHFKAYTGIYNITDGLLDLLKTKGESGVTFLKNQRAPRVGAPLRSGQLTRIEESSIAIDSIEIDIDITVPVPLNNIKLTLLI